jgi:hypothetical protein
VTHPLLFFYFCNEVESLFGSQVYFYSLKKSLHRWHEDLIYRVDSVSSVHIYKSIVGGPGFFCSNFVREFNILRNNELNW